MAAALRRCAGATPFTVPENLFRKITDEERAEWQASFDRSDARPLGSPASR
jgi:methionyl-tRNA synthetase